MQVSWALCGLPPAMLAFPEKYGFRTAILPSQNDCFPSPLSWQKEILLVMLLALFVNFYIGLTPFFISHLYTEQNSGFVNCLFDSLEKVCSLAQQIELSFSEKRDEI